MFYTQKDKRITRIRELVARPAGSESVCCPSSLVRRTLAMVKMVMSVSALRLTPSVRSVVVAVGEVPKM